MGKKILVADSDSVVQQVVSYFLKLEGFDVETVGDGVSAMEAIEKILPNVIIMTPVLPGLNGVEVSQFVRENPLYKAIPIIFLSESEEPLLNNIPDLSQKFGIVNKPIDPTKLVNTVKEYIEKVNVEKVNIEQESAPSDDVVESLKSIEELLGWDIPDKKFLYKTEEEVIQEKSMEESFDIAEMLVGINNVSAKETEVSLSSQSMDETPECYPELVSVSFVEEIPKQVRDDREGDRVAGFSAKAPMNPWPARDNETLECHHELVSGSFGKGASNLVSDDYWHVREESVSSEMSMVCELTTHDENPVCTQEPWAERSFSIGSGAQTMQDQEIPKQVRDDIEPMCDIEPMGDIEVMAYKEESEYRSDSAEEIFDSINESAVSEPDEAEDHEADLKSRITDEMIENMVRKIAVDIVDRVTRELVPEIAEREIIKEIERLKGIE